MILRLLGAWTVGAVQVFLVSLQTRQIAGGHRGLRVFATSCGISGVWSLGVVSVVASPWLAAAYTFGAACGTMAAVRLRLSVPDERRVRRHLLPRSLRRP